MTKTIFDKIREAIPEGETLCGKIIKEGKKETTIHVPIFNDEEGLRWLELKGRRFGDLLLHKDGSHRNGYERMQITAIASGTIVLTSHELSFYLEPVAEKDMVNLTSLLAESNLIFPSSLNEYITGSHLSEGVFGHEFRGLLEAFASDHPNKVQD